MKKKKTHILVKQSKAEASELFRSSSSQPACQPVKVSQTHSSHRRKKRKKSKRRRRGKEGEKAILTSYCCCCCKCSEQISADVEACGAKRKKKKIGK